MILRKATPGDAAAIAAIWNPIIRDSAVTFTSEEKTEDALVEMIMARGPAFIVAETAGAVLGFASYGAFRDGPGYAHVGEHTIHLAPHARGQGVGRALMRALEAQARRAGIRVLVAGISGENPAACGFHAALGFVEVGRMPGVGCKFGRLMDLILMQKTL